MPNKEVDETKPLSNRTERAPKGVRMIKVESSNVRSVGYDEDKKFLYVRFISGATYAYRGVPKSVAVGLVEAPSKGQYHKNYIQDKYEFVKGEPVEKGTK